MKETMTALTMPLCEIFSEIRKLGNDPQHMKTPRRFKRS